MSRNQKTNATPTDFSHTATLFEFFLDSQDESNPLDHPFIEGEVEVYYSIKLEGEKEVDQATDHAVRPSNNSTPITDKEIQSNNDGKFEMQELPQSHQFNTEDPRSIQLEVDLLRHFTDHSYATLANQGTTTQPESAVSTQKHHIITRSQAKSLSSTHTSLNTIAIDTKVPESLREALSSPHWLIAI